MQTSKPISPKLILPLRLLWILLAASFVAVLLFGVGPHVDELHELCSGPDCHLLILDPGEAVILQDWGFSVTAYTWYQVGIELFIAIILASVALIIFPGRSDEWIGLVVSMILVMFGTNFLSETDATLVLAALFNPLRRRIQGMADQRFNRGQYDLQQTLESFGDQLRDEVDLGEIESTLLSSVQNTLQLESLSLWLTASEGTRN